MPSTIGFNLRGQGTDSLELDLFEGIGADPLFGGGISAKSVLDCLNESPKAKKILVRINSAGGIVTEGLAIYNILKHHSAEVTCRVDGLAGSIASIIAMAGRLEMPSTSYLMIHNPFGWIEGGSSELRHQADVLDSMRQQMLDIYCAKCGKSSDFIGALMDEEKWMTGTEALAYGLADALIPSPNAKLAAHFDLSRYKNTPRSLDTARAEVVVAQPEIIVNTSLSPEQVAESVKAVLVKMLEDEPTITTPPAAEQPTEEAADNPAAPGEPVMDEQVYKDKIAALEAELADIKAKFEASETARAQAETEAIEAKAKAKKPAADDDEDDDDEMARTAVIAEAMEITGCKDVNKLLGALVAFGQNTKAKKSKETVAARVSSLIASGKMRPSMKAKALKMTEAQLDGYEEMIGDATVGPVGGEAHTGDEESPEVIAARASGKAPAAKFDPEKIQLTVEERQFCKTMNPHNPGEREKALLADKRLRAETKWNNERGVSSAA